MTEKAPTAPLNLVRPAGKSPEFSQSTTSGLRIEETTCNTSDRDHAEDVGQQDVFNRFSRRRKFIIVVVISWCGMLSPLSSTAVLSALPEVAKSYDTTGSMIANSNALYLVFMGLAPAFWGPLNQVYGRRWTSLVTSTCYLACSIGTALSPNVASFFAFRLLTAFTGTSFLVTAPAVIGDIFEPLHRATAMSWFALGTQVGPTVGPLTGGLIVTHQSWRVIFWLQTALAGIGLLGTLILLPETMLQPKILGLKHLDFSSRMLALWKMGNPWRILRLSIVPNMTLPALASGSIVWNMYSMLTPIRYVLNPRFSLTSPTESGLFFLAPGMGYVVGNLLGGYWADYTVQRWITKRNGQRIPEDRLRSCIPFLGFLLPSSMLVYGWSVQSGAGGIPLPVLSMFLGGISQTFSYTSLNTYCVDVAPENSAEAIAWNFTVRYIFGAIGSVASLPAIDKIGVGGLSTISAGFLAFGGLSTWIVIMFGFQWRTKSI